MVTTLTRLGTVLLVVSACEALDSCGSSSEPSAAPSDASPPATVVGTALEPSVGGSQVSIEPTTMPTARQSPECPAPAGIVSSWPAEETAADAVDGNHGQLKGNAEFGTGVVGSAFEFAGGGGYVEIADSQTLDFSTSMSVSAWVNPFSPGDNGGRVWVLLKGDNAQPADVSYGLMWGFTSIHFRIGDGTMTDEVIAEGTIDQLGQWTHVVGTFNGNTPAVYVNGTLAASKKSALTSIVNTTQPLLVGSSLHEGSVQHYFDGLIDEISVYNRALDAIDAASLARATNGECPPP